MSLLLPLNAVAGSDLTVLLLEKTSLGKRAVRMEAPPPHVHSDFSGIVANLPRRFETAADCSSMKWVGSLWP